MIRRDSGSKHDLDSSLEETVVTSGHFSGREEAGRSPDGERGPRRAGEASGIGSGVDATSDDERASSQASSMSSAKRRDQAPVAGFQNVSTEAASTPGSKTHRRGERLALWRALARANGR